MLIEAYLVLLITLSQTAWLSWRQSFRNLRRARAIEDVPTATIASAAQGRAEIAGIARHLPGARVEAPLSGTPCAWYRYRVDSKYRDAMGLWFDTGRARGSETPFYIEDQTGRCLVEPLDAQILSATRQVWYGSEPVPQGPPMPSLLPVLERFRRRNRYRYVEEIIPVGGSICAQGYFETLRPPGGAEPALRDKSRDLRLDFARQYPQDPEMVMLGRLAAANEQERAATWPDAGKPGGSDEYHLLRKPDNPGHHFLFSSLPQKEHARRLRQHSQMFFAWALFSGTATAVMIYVALDSLHVFDILKTP